MVALLDERGMENQAEMLRRNKLTVLDLYRCNIGHSARVVAEFLKVNETVTGVGLIQCNIDSLGAKLIADALKLNKTALEIELGGNLIQQEVGEALIDALNYNVCIKKFYNISREIATESPIAAIKYLTETRNKVIIPDAVRCAALYLIGIRRNPNYDGMGYFSIIDKNMVKMIAMEVWATRKDPIWLEALSESERTGN